MSVSLRPFGMWVVLEEIAPETVTKGGIALPDTAKRKSVEGRIVALGDEAAVKLRINPGARVFFVEGIGTKLRIGEKDRLLIQADDLYGVVEETAEPAQAEPLPGYVKS